MESTEKKPDMDADCAAETMPHMEAGKGKDGTGNLGAELTPDKKEAAPAYASRPMKAPFKDWTEDQWNKYVSSTGHKVDGKKAALPIPGVSNTTPKGTVDASAVAKPKPNMKKAEFAIRPSHKATQAKTASLMQRASEFNPQRHGDFNPLKK